MQSQLKRKEERVGPAHLPSDYSLFSSPKMNQGTSSYCFYLFYTLWSSLYWYFSLHNHNKKWNRTREDGCNASTL